MSDPIDCNSPPNKDDGGLGVSDVVVPTVKRKDPEQMSDSRKQIITRTVQELAVNLINYKLRIRDFVVASERVKAESSVNLRNCGIQSYHRIKTGSRGECFPGEVCADIDQMFINSSHPKVISRTREDAGFNLLVAEDCDLYPGYVLLKPGSKGLRPEYAGLVDKEGFFSSSDFMERMKPLAQKREDMSTALHGPAVVTRRSCYFDRLVTKLDNVSALKWPVWPDLAAEFFSREREFSWPPDALLQGLHSDGCLVVPVGHPLSDAKHKQWRYSFSLTERDLFHAASTKQAAAMFILKAIKSSHWKDIEQVEGKTKLCSYFLKTAAFWTFERNEDADNTDMFDLAQSILDHLIACYKSGFLANYFMRKQNLFKKLDHCYKDQIIKWLTSVKHDLWELTMSALHQDDFIRISLDHLSSGLGIQIPTRNSLGSFKQIIEILGQSDSTDDILRCIELARDLADHKQHPAMVSQTRSYVSYAKFFGYLEVRDDPVNLPERALLPQVEKLKAAVEKRRKTSKPEAIGRDCYDETLLCLILRHIGDWYHAISAYIAKDNTDASNICFTKAEYYYKEGLIKIHPDNVSDLGLGGYILLTKLYYLRGDREKLDNALEKLKPLLARAMKSDEIFNCLSYLVIHKDREVHKAPWLGDKEIWNSLDLMSMFFVNFHPMALAYYILVRRAIADHEEKATEKYFLLLVAVEKKLFISDQVQSARVLINILVKLIEGEHWSLELFFLRNWFSGDPDSGGWKESYERDKSIADGRSSPEHRTMVLRGN